LKTNDHCTYTVTQLDVICSLEHAWI